MNVHYSASCAVSGRRLGLVRSFYFRSRVFFFTISRTALGFGLSAKIPEFQPVFVSGPPLNGIESLPTPGGINVNLATSASSKISDLLYSKSLSMARIICKVYALILWRHFFV